MEVKSTDYQLVESNDVEFYGVKLLTGKWKNIVYIYGKVSIKESEELDIATLSFTYNIQDSAEYEEDDLINDINFRNYIGGILQHIISDSLDYAEENNVAAIGIGNDESNTNTHTQ